MAAAQDSNGRRTSLLKTEPQQDRARQMVEWILEAGRLVLTDCGPKHLTVQAIADRAGVSVGSLYRYFEDKDSIIEAVYRRVLDGELVQLETDLAVLEALPLRDALRVGIEGSVDRHRRLSLLHPHFFEEHASRLTLVTYDGEASDRVRALIERFLFSRRHELRKGVDVELATFIVHDGLTAIMRAAVQQRMDLVQHPGLTDTLTDLVVRFLTDDEEAADEDPRGG